MTNPAAQVTVTTEIGYCPFCRRSRTLRREERHLGGLVRINVDCESCHRTLSSTMGVPQPKAEEEPVAAEPVALPEVEAAPKPAPKRKPAAKAAAGKAAPRKTAATRKTHRG